MKTTKVTQVEAMQLKSRIVNLLLRLRDPSQHAQQAPFLPEIIQSLEAMADSTEAPRDRRVRMAGALARLVTEDFTFSESALGGEILELTNDFVLF